MTWEQIDDAPADAAGLLVGTIEADDGERGICVQIARTRVVLDPVDAREMAEALTLVASMIESGARVPGEHHVDQYAARSELERITDANRRALGLEGRGN